MPTSSELRGALLGGTDWSLLDVVVWLSAEGRFCPTLDAFVPALCERLRAAGAPLWRVRIGFRTLHPLVGARTCTWLRDAAAPQIDDVPHQEMQVADYLGSPIEVAVRTGQPQRYRLDRLDPERDHPVLFELRDRGGSDYLILPLAFTGDRFGTLLIVVADRAGGFSDADIAGFTALGEFIAPITESLTGAHVARSLLDTYLGPRTGQRVLDGRITRGDGEQIGAAIWYCDLRDSTALSERLDLPALLETLNQYFELVAAAVVPRGGEILSFIGDAMLVVFGTDEPRTAARDATPEAVCRAALAAAGDAYAALAELNRRRRRRAETVLEFGLGLHFGDVLYGNVGAPERLDFTVMGAAVNHAVRLEGLTKTLREPLLMSAAFAARLDASAAPRALGKHALKGFTAPQTVFAPASPAFAPSTVN